MKNDHIEKFLDYYLALPSAPEYAVLLRGNWGCGKSWFIRNYQKKRNDINFLYVTLNGMTSIREIEESFFEQLHPILASKGMRIASKALKGLV